MDVSAMGQVCRFKLLSGFDHLIWLWFTSKDMQAPFAYRTQGIEERRSVFRQDTLD
jgi:hypothetical protein